MYHWHMKTEIKNFHKNHPGSLIIIKMVNDPLHVRKENQSITLFRYYFNINKRNYYILLVNDGKNDDGQGKVTDDTWKDIL